MDTVNIAGIPLSVVNMPRAVETIEQWIATGETQYVCVRDMNGIVESQRIPALRQIHLNAGMVTPDGMPLVWISRFRGYPVVERVYGPDLMLALCARSVEKGYRHYFYGGNPGIPERLSRELGNKFEELNIVGMYSPPYRQLSPAEDSEIVERICQADPHIVWVGLGTPKQELWMASHAAKLEGRVLIGVGAAFDFLSGNKRQAPVWMRSVGLEWLYRLITEPRRLWRRYLINAPHFIWLVTLQALHLRKYAFPDSKESLEKGV